MNAAVSFISSRYFRSRRGKGFASLVTVVSFTGLVLGVVALTVVVSVMNGFDRELKQRILGSIPHVVVESASAVEVEQHLPASKGLNVAPFNKSQVLLTARGSSELVLLHGVDPALESGVSAIPDSMVMGELTDLEADSPGIVLGQGIARRLQIGPGDQLHLVVPQVSEAGELLRPQLRSVVLLGVFRLASELDYGLAVMHLDQVTALTDVPAGARIQLSDVFAAPLIHRQLANQGFIVHDWTSEFGDFFEAVRLEKIMMFVLLSFVIGVASFSIVSSLSMLVESKRRDVAVLRTMGLNGASVMQIFLWQGIGIAVAGVVMGLLIGVPLAFYIPEIMSWIDQLVGFSIVRGTYFDQIPTDVRAEDLLAIALVSLAISILATIYPARRAAKLEPARILRYE